MSAPPIFMDVSKPRILRCCVCENVIDDIIDHAAGFICDDCHSWNEGLYCQDCAHWWIGPSDDNLSLICEYCWETGYNSPPEETEGEILISHDQ